MSNPKIFVRFLQVIGPFFFFVSIFHVSMGLNADALMGVGVSSETMSDAGLDSQNRFYGVALSLYGAVLLLGATDLQRYAPVLKLSFICIFLAGVARFVSVALFGWPPLMIGLLFASEIILPPIAWIWLSKVLPQTDS